MALSARVSSIGRRIVRTCVIVATVAVGANCSGSDSAADDEEPAAGERITVQGVTFVIPEQLEFTVEPQSEPFSGDDAVVTVDLVDADASVRGTVRVATIRDARGEITADSTEDIDAALALEDGTAPGADVPFVNGAGVRDEADDGSFVFTGVTSDGAQLVEVHADQSWDVDVFDTLAGSVFVDGQSDALATAGCDPAIDVVGEVVVEGDGPVAPGAPVVASWRVSNAGTCPWSAGDGWVFAGGDGVELIEVSPVTETAPGEEAEVSVSIRAPSEPGQYSTQWEFLPSGERESVGPPVAVTFEVATA